MEPMLAPTASLTNDFIYSKSARQARNDGSLKYNPVEPMLAPADMFCSSP